MTHCYLEESSSLAQPFAIREQGLRWGSPKSLLSLLFNPVTWFDVAAEPSPHSHFENLSERRTTESGPPYPRPVRQERGQYGSLSPWNSGEDNCRSSEDPCWVHSSTWGGLYLLCRDAFLQEHTPALMVWADHSRRFPVILLILVPIAGNPTGFNWFSCFLYAFKLLSSAIINCQASRILI